MKFQFVKTLLMGSIFALGSIGLTACGDDSSSNAKGGDSSSSSAQKIVLSSASETSPLNAASKIEAKTLADGNGGWELSLTGSLSFDVNFVPEEGDEDEDYFFTFDSLSFIVGKIGDDGAAYLVDSLDITGHINFPVDGNISIASSFNKIPLNQSKIGCGKFVLYVWIYMSDDVDHTFKYSALKEVPFDLQCNIIESSSSEPAACTELVKETVTLSNNYGSDIYTLNIEGGTDPQLTMSVEADVFYLEAGPGVEIFEEIGDLTGGIDPEPPVCMEDMSVRNGTGTTKMQMDTGTMWYIVKTASGSYPFRVAPGSMASGSTGSLNLVYFKKK